MVTSWEELKFGRGEKLNKKEENYQQEDSVFEYKEQEEAYEFIGHANKIQGL